MLISSQATITSDNRPQNVEAYVAFKINVRVVNFCVATNFRRLVGIRLTDDKTEYKLSASVDALISATSQQVIFMIV